MEIISIRMDMLVERMRKNAIFNNSSIFASSSSLCFFFKSLTGESSAKNQERRGFVSGVQRKGDCVSLEIVF